MVQPEDNKPAEEAFNASKQRSKYKRNRSKSRIRKLGHKRDGLEQEQASTQGAQTWAKRSRRRRKPAKGGSRSQAEPQQADATAQQTDLTAEAAQQETSSGDQAEYDADSHAIVIDEPVSAGDADDETLENLSDLEDLEETEESGEPVETAELTAPEVPSAKSESEPVVVVGVRFRKSRKIYYFTPNELDLSRGDSVIVETVRGIELGTVVTGPKTVSASQVVMPLKPVMRKASVEDHLKAKENEEKEKQAFDICLGKIAKHGLPMKLVDTEYTFDRNKLIFYFTAEGRVDFRELVKDLAAVFKTRIELRQIGVRDEARMIGGLGCCGRPICCASFLNEFEPVSIKMAKEQNLSLNPTKISGVCGRLMCCLRYEYETYKAYRLGLPKIGQEVYTDKGKAKVADLDILRRLVKLDYGDGNLQVVPADQVEVPSPEEGAALTDSVDEVDDELAELEADGETVEPDSDE